MGILHHLDELDKKYSRRIHYLDFGHLNKVVYLMARFFNPENLASVYLIIFYLSNKNFFYVMIFLEGAALSLLLSIYLKGLIGRLRPVFPEDVTKSGYLRGIEKLNSMPSGDAIQAGYFAMFCMYHFNNPYVLAICFFALYGRVHFVIHWIGDIIVGMIIGLSFSYLLQSLFMTIVQWGEWDLNEFYLSVILENLFPVPK
mmetsp:Transcript_42417/g.49122  ORF Transcript_42417/g.49122 Transcript_42417/m.49122 type:complete len:200 (+) Transcript_42417:30-629(+)